ncbi:endoplasmic reticulum-Golgi intermediate compartment protein 3 [Rhodnius prolixus]
MKKHFENLKEFDAYYKPIDDYHERTLVGGTVSILSWLTIILLGSLRIYEHWTVQETTETILVDSSRNPKLFINLAIVLPHISCDYLSFDAMDSSGEQHLHIDHNIYKTRLDLDGNAIEEPKKEELVSKPLTTESVLSVESTTPKCGSCYGAEDSNHQEKLNITCCNTCEDVQEAYRKRRWHMQENKVEQCKHSPNVIQMEKAFQEGCKFEGFMKVNRVAGSFHIAPGQSFSINHVHVHDVQPFTSNQFNTTHHVKHLSFGQTQMTFLNVSPLDGTVGVAHEGAKMFSYYIKIVPTMYVTEDGQTVHTNQFSVTKHEKVMTVPNRDSGMPGIFFSYELSAMMVKISEKKIPISHVVTDLCSIVGGVWIVAMFIDSIFYRSSKLLHKIDLGKAS